MRAEMMMVLNFLFSLGCHSVVDASWRMVGLL